MMCSRLKLLMVLTLLAACGADERANNGIPDCPEGTQYNPIGGECTRIAQTLNNLPITDVGNGIDVETVETDAGVDTAMPIPLTCQIDADGDGAFAMECGGDDCDDSDARRFPGNGERCDEVDNDCDDELNEVLDCTILAHSDTRLYRVDFFAGTYEDLGATIADLWDIDTHPDGTLYGIAGDRLHTFVPASNTWVPATTTLGIATQPNGFCIDNEGNAFVMSAMSSVLSEVDLATGRSAPLGSMAPTTSSGDCVVNKGNVLFLTSSHTEPDSFARIDGSNGAATVVGRTGYDGIWGLTAAYNRVFGLTAEGFVVEIDVNDGSTTVIAQYPEISFYGAASTPGR